MRFNPLLLMLMALLIFGLSCGDDEGENKPPTGTGETKVTVVGPEGATITLEGADLVIPAGALQEEVEITIQSTTQDPTGNFVRHSAVFRFEPAGQNFLVPVTVRIPYTGTPSSPSIYWASAGAPFASIGGADLGGKVEASIMHFSEGFVGTVPPPANNGGTTLGQPEPLVTGIVGVSTLVFHGSDLYLGIPNYFMKFPATGGDAANAELLSLSVAGFQGGGSANSGVIVTDTGGIDTQNGGVHFFDPVAGTGSKIYERQIQIRGLQIEGDDVFWIARRTTEFEVRRGNINGDATEVLASTPDMTAFVMDETHVYYSSRNGFHRVLRAGGSPERLTPAQAGSWSIALDATHLYYSLDGGSGNNVGAGGIYRIPKAGGEPQELVGGQAESYQLVLHNDHVYFINLGLQYQVEDGEGNYVDVIEGAAVRRVPKTGGAAETITELEKKISPRAPLSVHNGYLHWWAPVGESGQIMRVRLP